MALSLDEVCVWMGTGAWFSSKSPGRKNEFAKLAAEGRFTVPIARTFPLDDWREALAASLSGHAHGKLVLLLADAA